MDRPYDDPWMKAKSGKPAACHYGCGKMATLTEPGRPWKAHKACALGSEPPVPLGDWDGEEHKLKPDAPYGCGGDDSPTLIGRRCAGVGDRLACQLCPESPTYWRNER